MTSFVDEPVELISANVVVSKRGDGNYKTIEEALRAISSGAKGRCTIYIKSGLYLENVVISRPDVALIGDGVSKTIISSRLNNDDGYSILVSAAVTVSADNFIAKSICFQNTSGPQKNQAVALTCSGDKCAFYKCLFIGYQDTLFLNHGRQFYRECEIHGTIDFIFGDAAAVLQECTIALKKPITGQEIVITAQGRENGSTNTGISIHGCTITTARDFQLGSTKCYLGRPWKKYSRTMIMKTYIHKAIDPSGWLDMNGNHNTAEYREYDNYGPGSATKNRVHWPGYEVLKTAEEAKPYTVAELIEGNKWLPSTGIPFIAGV